MNYFKLILKIVIIICYSFFGGCLLYQKISLGYKYIGIEFFFFGILFILFSAAGMGVSFKIPGQNRKMNGVKIWLIAMLLTCLTLFTYDFVKNISKSIFIAEIYWDGGIELHLRENGTYKSINYDLLFGIVKYGSYEIYEKGIIIEDELRLGTSIIKDTLIYDVSGFKLLYTF